jgi:cell division protein FtsA
LSRTVLAIDIGSTKICAIIAEVANDNSISITGTGVTKAHGLKRGSIINIELASRSIKTAVEDAKRVAGTEVNSAIVSISGAYTKSLNSNGIVNIQTKEISFEEIQRVMRTSLYNANIPSEYEVLHALPFNFKVDDQDYIEDPLGMNASRLEVETHIITTQKSNLNNLKKSVRSAGIEVENVVLNSYASAIATLNDDERELGAAVIDMGGNTSNIAIYSGNSIRYNEFLGVGSNHVTNDLSMALHTPLNIADTVKLEYGSLLTPSDDLIELPVIGDESTTHEVSLEVVHNVIFARVEETLMILAQFIEKSGLKDQIGAGIVITGGFSKMEGIRELAVATFGSIPVRLAKPKEMNGLFDSLRDPRFASAVGLVMFATKPYTPYEIDVNKRVRHSNEEPVNSIKVNFQTPQYQETTNTQGDTEIPVATASEEEQPPRMINLEDKGGREQQESQPGVMSKIWNWATQLF